MNRHKAKKVKSETKQKPFMTTDTFEEKTKLNEPILKCQIGKKWKNKLKYKRKKCRTNLQ